MCFVTVSVRPESRFCVFVCLWVCVSDEEWDVDVRSCTWSPHKGDSWEVAGTQGMVRGCSGGSHLPVSRCTSIPTNLLHLHLGLLVRHLNLPHPACSRSTDSGEIQLFFVAKIEFGRTTSIEFFSHVSQCDSSPDNPARQIFKRKPAEFEITSQTLEGLHWLFYTVSKKPF